MQPACTWPIQWTAQLRRFGKIFMDPAFILTMSVTFYLIQLQVCEFLSDPGARL